MKKKVKSFIILCLALSLLFLYMTKDYYLVGYSDEKAVVFSRIKSEGAFTLSYLQSLYRENQTEHFSIEGKKIRLKQLTFSDSNSLTYYDNDNLNYTVNDGKYTLFVDQIFKTIPLRVNYSHTHNLIYSNGKFTKQFWLKDYFNSGNSIRLEVLNAFELFGLYLSHQVKSTLK